MVEMMRWPGVVERIVDAQRRQPQARGGIAVDVHHHRAALGQLRR
jgi:hypothetical protein